MPDYPDADDFGVPIHRIPKSKSREVRICVQEFAGHRSIHIREFYIENEEYHPGKGVTLRVDQYADLLEGVVALGEFLGVDETS